MPYLASMALYLASMALYLGTWVLVSGYLRVLVSGYLRVLVSGYLPSGPGIWVPAIGSWVRCHWYRVLGTVPLVPGPGYLAPGPEVPGTGS